jgi:hypothetical protein
MLASGGICGLVSALCRQIPLPRAGLDASPIDSYDALISALRAHIAAIDVTFDSVDTIAGNPTRYAAKFLGQPPIRRMTVYTLLNLCAAVGLRLTLTRDDHRLAQLRRRSQWAEPDVSTLVGNPFCQTKKDRPGCRRPGKLLRRRNFRPPLPIQRSAGQTFAYAATECVAAR